MKPRKYTLKENLISALLGVSIAIPICISAHKSQDVNSITIETIPVETTVEEPKTVEPLSSKIEVATISREVPEITKAPKIEYISLGEFKVTAYCSCKKCCGKWADNRPNGIVYGASGNELIPNYSIAVDPDVIPYGTKVYFDDKEYIAHDCGGGINGNDIDLYFDSHEDALAWGVQYFEVYTVEE